MSVVSWRDMCRASSLKMILFTSMLVAGVRGEVSGPCVPNPPAGQLGLVCPAEVGGPEDQVEVSKASHSLGLELGPSLTPHAVVQSRSQAGSDAGRVGRSPPSAGGHDAVTVQGARIEGGGIMALYPVATGTVSARTLPGPPFLPAHSPCLTTLGGVP